MRLLTATGILVLSAGTALGSYLVELDGGDRMTVDSYWEDGNRMHLMRGGGELIVPKSRVRKIRPADDEGETAGVGRSAPRTPSRPSSVAEVAPPTDEETRRALQGARVRIERHSVRVTRDISVARARGDSPKRLRRLERELSRTWQRRNNVKRALGETD